MPKYFLCLFIVLFSSCNPKATTGILMEDTKYSKVANVYDVYITFGSIGIGTPSDKPIKNLLTHFENTHDVKFLQIDKIGPLGKEGEYALGFVLTDWTENLKKTFSQELRKLDFSQDKSQGYVNVIENQKMSEINKPSIATIEKYNWK